MRRASGSQASRSRYSWCAMASACPTVAASAAATVAMGLRSNGANTVTSDAVLAASGTIKAYRSVTIAAPRM